MMKKYTLWLALALGWSAGLMAATGPGDIPIYPNTNQFTFSGRQLTIKPSAVITNPSINGVAMAWPTNNAGGSLVNNGAGALTWSGSGAGGIWTNDASRVRLITTNANSVLELGGNDGAGGGSVELWTAGSKRWTVNDTAIYPEGTKTIGTSLNPVGTLYLNASSGLLLGDRIISSGSASPEGAHTAPIGSLFLRTDGASGATLYSKVSGTNETGWQALSSWGAIGGDLSAQADLLTQLTNKLDTTTGGVINGPIDVGGEGDSYFSNLVHFATPPTGVLSFTPVDKAGDIMGGLLTLKNTAFTNGSASSSTIDLDVAFCTQSVTGAVAVTAAINGATNQLKKAAKLWLNSSGSDQDFSIPGIWGTNAVNAVPTKLTNGWATLGEFLSIGPTTQGSSQRNCMAQFTYWKLATPPTYLFTENFETATTGYENTWSQYTDGTMSAVESTSGLGLDGAQCLKFDLTNQYAVIERNIGADKDELWFYCLVRLHALSATYPLFTIYNQAGVIVTDVWIDGATRKLTVSNGDNGPPSAQTTDGLALDTTYSVWVHFKKGTGVNGVSDVEFSTSAAKLGSGNKFAQVSNGTATTAARKVDIGYYMSPITSLMYFDYVRIHDSAIGDYP